MTSYFTVLPPMPSRPRTTVLSDREPKQTLPPLGGFCQVFCHSNKAKGTYRASKCGASKTQLPAPRLAGPAAAAARQLRQFLPRCRDSIWQIQPKGQEIHRGYHQRVLVHNGGEGTVSGSQFMQYKQGQVTRSKTGPGLGTARGLLLETCFQTCAISDGNLEDLHWMEP